MGFHLLVFGGKCGRDGGWGPERPGRSLHLFGTSTPWFLSGRFQNGVKARSWSERGRTSVAGGAQAPGGGNVYFLQGKQRSCQ